MKIQYASERNNVNMALHLICMYDRKVKGRPLYLFTHAYKRRSLILLIIAGFEFFSNEKMFSSSGDGDGGDVLKILLKKKTSVASPGDLYFLWSLEKMGFWKKLCIKFSDIDNSLRTDNACVS